MNHLTAFLSLLQTFELRISNYVQPRKNYLEEKVLVKGYDISHETPYYDSFSFKSSIRVMKDMALIDLLALDQPKLELQLLQMKKLIDRFNGFWKNYHEHYSGYNQEYKPSYLFRIRLQDLFIVHNLQPDYADLLISEKFVEDLSESVKLREKFLKELIKEVEGIIKEHKEAIQVPMRGEVAEPSESPIEEILAAPTVARSPAFKEGIVNDFFSILKSYFSPDDQEHLSVLLKGNIFPTQCLLYNDNGNQLADAFKQLFEANLIVGCSKADLEEWITGNFQYVYNGQLKSFTAGYLNGIISSNAKKCQSPILDVKRQQDGNYIVVPTIRTNKSTKN